MLRRRRSHQGRAQARREARHTSLVPELSYSLIISNRFETFNIAVFREPSGSLSIFQDPFYFQVLKIKVCELTVARLNALQRYGNKRLILGIEV